jgi:hypothetical protein
MPKLTALLLLVGASLLATPAFAGTRCTVMGAAGDKLVYEFSKSDGDVWLQGAFFENDVRYSFPQGGMNWTTRRAVQDHFLVMTPVEAADYLLVAGPYPITGGTTPVKLMSKSGNMEIGWGSCASYEEDDATLLKECWLNDIEVRGLKITKTSKSDIGLLPTLVWVHGEIVNHCAYPMVGSQVVLRAVLVDRYGTDMLGNKGTRELGDLKYFLPLGNTHLQPHDSASFEVILHCYCDSVDEIGRVSKGISVTSYRWKTAPNARPDTGHVIEKWDE